MGYIKAEEVLPAEVIELIQKYVDGVAIYIPRRDGKRAGWGEVNQAKEKIYVRDMDIYEEYRRGTAAGDLAEKYCLSVKSIWRIVRKMKGNCQSRQTV